MSSVQNNLNNFFDGGEFFKCDGLPKYIKKLIKNKENEINEGQLAAIHHHQKHKVQTKPNIIARIFIVFIDFMKKIPFRYLLSKDGNREAFEKIKLRFNQKYDEYVRKLEKNEVLDHITNLYKKSLSCKDTLQVIDQREKLLKRKVCLINLKNQHEGVENDPYDEVVLNEIIETYQCQSNLRWLGFWTGFALPIAKEDVERSLKKVEKELDSQNEEVKKNDLSNLKRHSEELLVECQGELKIQCVKYAELTQTSKEISLEEIMENEGIKLDSPYTPAGQQLLDALKKYGDNSKKFIELLLQATDTKREIEAASINEDGDFYLQLSQPKKMWADHITHDEQGNPIPEAKHDVPGGGVLQLPQIINGNIKRDENEKCSVLTFNGSITTWIHIPFNIPLVNGRPLEVKLFEVRIYDDQVVKMKLGDGLTSPQVRTVTLKLIENCWSNSKVIDAKTDADVKKYIAKTRREAESAAECK